VGEVGIIWGSFVAQCSYLSHLDKPRGCRFRFFCRSMGAMLLLLKSCTGSGWDKIITNLVPFRSQESFLGFAILVSLEMWSLELRAWHLLVGMTKSRREAALSSPNIPTTPPQSINNDFTLPISFLLH